MTAKKRGLGRGLEVLLSSAGIEESVKSEGNLRHIPIEIIQRGKYQPRKDMRTETLQELADSIQKQGIIQPIVVRSIAANRYEIIAGERRWRAAQMAGLTDIPALVRNVPDEAAIAMALIENIQRENLNPIEEAAALSRLLTEFTMTHEQVAQAVGKSRVTVTNLLRLLALHPEVKTLVEKGEIEMGHARAILALDNKLQMQAARTVLTQKLSVRETEKLVNRLQNKSSTPQAKPRQDPDLQRLQQKISETLGAKVTFQHHPKGHGKMIIDYHSVDELEGILARVK